MKNSSDNEDIEVILFTSLDSILAVESSSLVEVLEPVQTSPLPFVPSYVEGLINVNGQIIPQINLAKLIFGDEAEASYNSANPNALRTLLIIKIGSMLLALNAGQVLEPVVISSENLQPVKKKKGKKSTASIKEEYLSGTFAHQNKEVWLISADHFADVVMATQKPSGKPGFLGEVVESREEKINFNEYLIISVQGIEYACELNDVFEIIDLETIRSLPRAPELIEGMSLIRGEPRLILDLSELLGYKQGEKKQVQANEFGLKTAIMVESNGIFSGFLIDKLVGLETIVDTNVREDRDKKMKTLVRQDGETVTRIIQFMDLIDKNIKKIVLPYMPDYKQSSEEVKIKQIELLRFVLQGDAYALHVEEIRRVVANRDIEPLLQEQDYIIGTMEIEGRVIPVIDLVKQLGYDSSKIDDVTEYIVVNDGKNDWSLAIKGTDQIVQIDETKIDLVDQKNVNYVTAYGNYDESVLTILNPGSICKENSKSHAV